MHFNALADIYFISLPFKVRYISNNVLMTIFVIDWLFLQCKKKKTKTRNIQFISIDEGGGEGAVGHSLTKLKVTITIRIELKNPDVLKQRIYLCGKNEKFAKCV